MDKPKPQTVIRHDFNKCMDYIEEKYNFQHRDYAQKFKTYQSRMDALIKEHGYDQSDFEEDLTKADKNDPEVSEKLRRRKEIHALHDTQVPYLDYWHWVADAFEIHNGCNIEFSNETLDMVKEDKANTEVAEEYKGWMSRITEYLLVEFGEGENREIQFHIWW